MSGAMGPINPSDYVVRLKHEPTWTASFVEGVVNWEEAGGVWKLAAYVAAFVMSFIVLVSVVFSPAFFTGVREYEAIHLEKEFQRQVPSYGELQPQYVTDMAGKMTEDQARELVVNVQLQKALLLNPELMAQLIKDPGLRKQIEDELAPAIAEKLGKAVGGDAAGQLAELTAKLEGVTARARAAEARIATAESEAQTNGVKARDAARERDTAVAEIGQLKDQLARAKQQAQAHQGNASQVAELAEARVAEVAATAKREKADLTRELEAAREQARAAQSGNEALREQLRQATERLRDQTEQARAAKTELAQAELTHGAALGDKERALLQAQAQLKQAAEQVKSLQAQVDAGSKGAGEELTTARAQLTAKTEALSKAQLQVTDLEGRLGEATAAAKRFESEAQRITRLLEITHKENKEHVRAQEEAHAAFLKANAEVTKLTREKAELQGKLDTATADLDTATKEVTRQKRLVGDRDQTIALTQRERDELQTSLTALKKQSKEDLAALQGKFDEADTARANAERQLKAAQAQAGTEISGLREELATAQKQAAAALKQKTDENATLAAKVRELSEAATSKGAADKVNEELRAQLVKLESELGATIAGGGMAQAVAALKKELAEQRAAAGSAKSAIALANGKAEAAEAALKKQQADFAQAKTDKGMFERDAQLAKAQLVALKAMSQANFERARAGGFNWTGAAFQLPGAPAT